MQTPKSKASPLEVPSKTSPKTPRTVRQIKMPGSGSEPVLSLASKGNKTCKDQSPKVIDRKTPHSPVSEKKRQSKASDLENQIVRLQEDLKQTKDKVISSELLKEQAELEAVEAKQQLSAMTTKLADTEKQLMYISDMEKSRVHELCKNSQDPDKVWESEFEAAQKQHSVDSANPSSALNDIRKRPDVEAESDAGQMDERDSPHDKFHSQRSEHEKTVAMVEKLGVELSDCKKTEAQVLEKLENTQSLLEAATEENETLKLNSLNVIQDCNTIASELEESKASLSALEMQVSKLQSELVTYGARENGMNGRSAGAIQHCQENGQSDEIEQLKLEVMNLKCEDSKLRVALEAAESRYQEVILQSTREVSSAYEQAESAKLDFKSKEAELQKAEFDIKELQAKLADQRNRLDAYGKQESLNNAEINEIKQLEFHLRALHEALLEKENSLQAVEKENEILKRELQKWEMGKSKASDVSDADILAEARAGEQMAVSKFQYLTEESDKNNKRTVRVIEQLDAAQAANAELESELRKLKVQSDQWRKAAEAAAAMITSGNNNGKYIDRTGSLDSSYHHTLGGRISSPFSDDLNNEDSVKKKNGNMLKKIGVLWKKGQNLK